MNDKIEVPTMKVPPLKKICMTIGQLPSSYLETMSYYEMLVWFVNYLRDDIIPVVNANGEATKELQELFVELQSYVNNYFDNLDVQEEINNKLDEMAESGQLTDIIAQYLGLAGMITFNNVTEMKTATNLVNGSKCCTLGYHNINDGGNATYKIRTITNDDVIDEQFIIELNDNNLIAELIIDDVNIKQLGAYGDNTHDDTLLIQNAINVLKNKVITSNDLSKEIILTLNNGNYKITNTINLSPLVKLKTNGQVILSSYIENGTTLILNPSIDNLIEYETIDQIVYYGNYINGEGGLFIINQTESTNVIALQIGVTSQNLKERVAHMKLNNLTIHNFKVGILLTMNNIYCDTFERVNLGENEVDVQIGLQNTNLLNSGERISFIDCQFGASTSNESCFKFYQTCYLYFNNCSFDYARCFFLDSSNEKTMINIVIDNSHLEGSASNYNASLPYGIVYGYFKYGNIIINNSIIACTNEYKLFTTGTNQSSPQFAKYSLQLNNVSIVSGPDLNKNASNKYLVADDVNLFINNVNVGKLENYGRLLNNNYNPLYESNYDSVSLGSYSITGDNIALGKNTLSYVRNIKSTAEIITSPVNSNEKAIKFLASGGGLPRLSITTDYFDTEQNKEIFATSWAKGFRIIRIKYYFYDSTKTLLSSSSTTATANIDHAYDINYNFPYLKREIVPKNTKYCRIEFIFENTDSTHSFVEDEELIVGTLEIQQQ